MFKKVMLASAVAIAFASPAHALTKVSNFDWVTPFGTYNDIVKIGMLGLGDAQVTQEVNGAGNVYVGAKFSEYGSGFSMTYVDKNNAPGFFGQPIFFDFVGLSGSVTGLNANGGFNYKFDPTGAINVSIGTAKTPWFSTPVLGINGSIANSIGLNVKGTSEILALAHPGAGAFFDENNDSLAWFQAIGGLFFDVVTTNTVNTATGMYDCDGTGPGTKMCRTFGVASTGDITLYRVPEPASLALLGLGLLGLGATRRRNK